MAHKYRDLTKRVADLEFVAPPEELIDIRSEVFGFFRVGKRADPSGVYRSKPCFVKSLKLVGGEWVETDDPYTVTLPIKMEKVLRAVGKKRFIVIVGGRGSGKSQGVVDICADRMQRKSKVGFFREFANSIDDSTHPLLAEEIERLGMQGFRILKREIEHRSGGLSRFKGLARNAQSVKGMALFNIFATDEAQTVSDKSLKIMTPTMRSHGGSMIFCANPGSAADPFSQRFIVPYMHKMIDGVYEDALHLIMVLNHDDNPFFPMALEEERLFDITYLSAAMYDHVWNGAFDDSVEDAIIPAEWFDAAIDSHRVLNFMPTGQRAASLDPADVGNDNKAYIETVGGVLVDFADSWYEGDANDAADRAISYAVQNDVDALAWDVSGLGAGLRRDLTQGALIDRVVGAYNGGEGVNRPDDPVEMDSWLLKNRAATGNNVYTNKDLFMNRRSQDAYYLRRRFEKTYLALKALKAGKPNPFTVDELISISSTLPKDVLTRMRSEVCRVPRVYNASGKFQVMPKPEMKKKLKIPSPGLFDCMLMLQQPPEPDYTPEAANHWRTGTNY